MESLRGFSSSKDIEEWVNGFEYETYYDILGV
jgi:hypothetical protein